MFDAFIASLQSLALSSGPLGIFFASFLAGSIFPLPSEVVMFAQGLVGLKLIEITIIGGLGLSLGSIIGYYLGKLGRSFLEKYGKFFFVSPSRLKFLDRWFKKWESYAVLIGRAIPLIPYKIFSIACGLTKLDFKKYFPLTLIASFPRSFLLAYFGSLVSSTQNIPLTLTVIAIFFLLPGLIERMR